MPLWRSVLRLRCPATYASVPGRGPFFTAPFHSTPVSAAKYKAKFDYDKDERKSQQPSKNYARYIVRQKRSDAKRVLNEFLLKGGYKRNVQPDLNPELAKVAIIIISLMNGNRGTLDLPEILILMEGVLLMMNVGSPTIQARNLKQRSSRPERPGKTGKGVSLYFSGQALLGGAQSLLVRPLLGG